VTARASEKLPFVVNQTTCLRCDKVTTADLDDIAFWREMTRMPDLQALLDRAGRRYAALFGEQYDPKGCRLSSDNPRRMDEMGCRECGISGAASDMAREFRR